MSDEDPTPEELLPLIASVMRNPVRENGITCQVCTTPVSGYSMCRPCYLHRADGAHGSKLADQVIPLTYALKGTQAYRDAFAYKDIGRHRSGWQRFATLTTLFTVRHGECVNAVTRDPASTVLVVPSLADRP